MNHSGNLVFVVDENGNLGKFTCAAKMINESQNYKFLFGKETFSFQTQSIMTTI